MGLKEALLKWLATLLFIVNLVLLVPALLAGLARWVPPETWFWPNTFALLSPYWFVLPALWLLGWAWKRKWAFAAPNLLILVVFYSAWPLAYQRNGPLNESRYDIRVVTMNVDAFRYRYHSFHKTLAFLKKYKPDILCLQEFQNQRGEDNIVPRALKELKAELGLQYSAQNILLKKSEFGQVILSRYPIKAHGNAMPNVKHTLNGGVYADIELYGETMRVYCVHLESYYLTHQQRKVKPFEKEGQRVDLNVKLGWGILKRLLKGWRKQAEQLAALTAQPELHSPTTLIVGDLNNPPGCYAYHRLLGPMQDSFVQRGNGHGGTYLKGTLPLRIDYVLAGSKFQIAEHTVLPATELSDHHALLVRLRFRFHGG